MNEQIEPFTNAERMYYEAIIKAATPGNPIYLGRRDYLRLMEYARFRPFTAQMLREPGPDGTTPC